MPQRRSELAEPILRHSRDFYKRLNELRLSHPHIPVRELEYFLINPPPVANEPAKPAPSKEVSMAARIWPHLSKEK
jgi:hypothetical protein